MGEKKLEPLTSDELRTLVELEKNATPPPWKPAPDGAPYLLDGFGVEVLDRGSAELVAWLRNAAPLLFPELLTLREENERLRRAVVERDRAIEKGVRHVCDSMRAWRDAMDDEGHDVRAVDETFRRIGKSALLDRLIYRCEPLRTEKCPAHKGKWSGIPSSDAECPHGCALTGWLPVKPAPEAPAG